MGSPGPFRALSIDLWFTTFYHEPEAPALWDEARVRVIREVLARTNGPTLLDEEVSRAAREVIASFKVGGFPAVTVDPGRLLRAVEERLQARVVEPREEAERAFSAAGLEECPPRANPEAQRLLRTLARLRIPSVLVTNSSRRASTWTEFLRRHTDLPFAAVVSSCDLGVAKPDPRIFLEAARLVGVPAEAMLHVGDRWELDVLGARAAGCSAVLYRGLWAKYPPGMYAALPEPPSPPAGARVLDQLDPLCDPGVWSGQGSSGAAGGATARTDGRWREARPRRRVRGHRAGPRGGRRA